jgi:hypothetical protein
MNPVEYSDEPFAAILGKASVLNLKFVYKVGAAYC